MPRSAKSREEELRQILIDAIEVQLAAFKAGISFWREWVEKTSEFVTSATNSLSNLNSEDQETKDVLLEVVDAARESIRAMTELPRHTATRFIEELDELKKKQKSKGRKTRPKAAQAQKSTKPPRGAGRAGKKKSPARPRRAGRVKA